KEKQSGDYYENILILLLSIDSLEDLKTGDSYQQFYEIWFFLDVADNTIERVQPAVDENTAKYETYNADLEAMEDTFRKVAEASEIEEWALMAFVESEKRAINRARDDFKFEQGGAYGSL
ncbi:unnamed protein product, partial [Didymodactylos carnosus]